MPTFWYASIATECDNSVQEDTPEAEGWALPFTEHPSAVAPVSRLQA